MKSRICLILLSAATLFAPLAASAQVDPSSSPMNPATNPTSQAANPWNPSQQSRSQNQQQQQPGNARAAMASNTQDSTATPGVTAQDMKDKIFLRKAAEGGMAEVKLGQLASDKASSPEVKSFGQKMVTDHTMLNDEMKPIAESMGIMLPKKLSKKDQDEYDKLNSMSGTDFDTEYITYMDKDHHEDVREFRQEAASANDPTLKAAVDKGLTVIREHTRMVDKLAKDRGIPTPTRGGAAPPTPPTQ